MIKSQESFTKPLHDLPILKLQVSGGMYTLRAAIRAWIS